MKIEEQHKCNLKLHCIFNRSLTTFDNIVTIISNVLNVSIVKQLSESCLDSEYNT